MQSKYVDEEEARCLLHRGARPGSTGEVRGAGTAFKAIADRAGADDPTRASRLSSCAEACVCNVEPLGLAQPTVTHLKC